MGLTVLVFAAAKAKGSHLKVHFKNTVNVAAAIKGMTLERAKVRGCALAHSHQHCDGCLAGLLGGRVGPQGGHSV